MGFPPLKRSIAPATALLASALKKFGSLRPGLVCAGSVKRRASLARSCRYADACCGVSLPCWMAAASVPVVSGWPRAAISGCCWSTPGDGRGTWLVEVIAGIPFWSSGTLPFGPKPAVINSDISWSWPVTRAGIR